MSQQQSLNLLALNQNILGNFFTMGQGFKGSEVNKPLKSLLGFKVYLNGKTVLPRILEITERYYLGTILHPYAMTGMPDTPGMITYEFGITAKEYILIISLALDEYDFAEQYPDAAFELLAVTKRSDINDSVDNPQNYLLIIKEMLLLHFHQLFENYEDLDEIERRWEFEAGHLHDLFYDYRNKQDQISKIFETHISQQYDKNVLALNEIILGKNHNNKQVYTESDGKKPLQSILGLKVYLNGKCILPEISDIQEKYYVGGILHPSVMPDTSGMIKYEFGITKTEYIMLISLELDKYDWAEVSDDAATDILAVIKRADINVNKDSSTHYSQIIKDMLLLHFHQLFENYEDLDDLQAGWELKEDLIQNIFHEYKIHKKRVKGIFIRAFK